MHCIDCIQKNPDETPDTAVVYLFNDYESVRPLCENCYDDYAYSEGEMNLDSYYIDITGMGQYEFIKKINSNLKYLNEMNKRFSDRYFAVKKMVKGLDDGDSVFVENIREAIKW